MKIFKLELRTIAIGITAISVLALSSPVLGADNPQTPCANEPADVGSQSVSPYVPPANVYVPESSKAVPGDAGKGAHTNILIRKPSETEPRTIEDLSQPEPAANSAR
jgi:hypothetical protein